MSETPRQNAQASRHARRQSPYTRVPAQESAAPSTPSRLRSLLSYVSPFRSGRKAKVEAAPTNDLEEQQLEQAATTPSADTESGDNGYSAKSESASSARATDEFDAPHAGPSTSTGFDAPTAFTPHFRLDTPALATVNNPPAFGTTSEAPSKTPAFRRKRPLYVGAGYTGRRKRVVKPAPAEIAAGPDAAVSGKRRRLVTADDDVSPPIRSTGGLGHTSEVFGPVSPSRPLSLDAAANARSSTTDSAQVVSAPKRTATRAADLVMDILRSEVPQEPALANISRREQDVTRILNPYDTEENLLSTTVSSSRTAIPPAIPKKKGGSVSPSSNRASGAESLTETKETSPTELLQRTMPAAYRRETLQHQRTQHSSPQVSQQSTPASAKQQSDLATKTKRQVAVLEILSSEDEEEEEVDDAKSASEGSREENEAETMPLSAEESDRADESGNHVASDEEELDSGGSDHAGVMVIDSAEEEASSGSGSFSPGPELDHSTVQSRAPGAMAAAPAVPSTPGNPFVRQVPVQASVPKSTSPIFSFGPKAGNVDTAEGLVESTLSAKPDTSAVRDDAAAATDRWRRAALDLPRASLPTQSFCFVQVMAEISHATVSVDPTLSGLAELAKNVSRGELPTFSF